MALQGKNSRNTMFFLISIMGLFAILSSTMSKSPVLNPFATSLKTPEAWMGFVAAASTIPGIIISLPAASLSDIFGRKKFLLIGGFVFASAPFLYLLITAWWQLILVRFYHGFATGIFVPIAEALIVELFPSQRGKRISLFSSATYVGRVTAPVLGGYVLFITSDNFHVLYLAVAVAGVTALIMSLPFSTEKKQSITPRQETANEIVKGMFRGWGTVVRNRGVLVVGFVQACQYYAYGAAEFFLAGYLPEIAQLNKFLTGIIITSVIGVAIFVKPYMGKFSDKIGRQIPITVGCVVSGLPLLAIPFVTNFWILFLLVVIYGFGFATVTASTPALISELVPKEFVGTSMGFLGTIMDVGQTLGPLISGFILATNLKYYGVFPSLTFVLLFSCIIFVLNRAVKTSFRHHT